MLINKAMLYRKALKTNFLRHLIVVDHRVGKKSSFVGFILIFSQGSIIQIHLDRTLLY